MTDDNDRLDAAVDEAAALRLAVEALTASILGAVPREESRYKTLAILAVIGGPLLFVLTMGFGVYVYQAQGDTIRELRQGTECLLADLDDHRHTNQFAHNKLAEVDHIEIIQPDVTPLTPGQVQRLKSACTPFIKRVTGNAAGESGRTGR